MESELCPTSGSRRLRSLKILKNDNYQDDQRNQGNQLHELVGCFLPVDSAATDTARRKPSGASSTRVTILECTENTQAKTIKMLSMCNCLHTTEPV